MRGIRRPRSIRRRGREIAALVGEEDAARGERGASRAPEGGGGCAEGEHRDRGIAHICICRIKHSPQDLFYSILHYTKHKPLVLEI